MPEVSVIIPNYNHAAYLKERIDSVLNQTYQDFELIILDDLSPDNSREIIELYRGHPKVTHIVYNEVNSGSTFKQWEKGFSIAQGNYIWIAESDDWCEPSLLGYLVHGLKENKECVIAYCQSYCILNNKIYWKSDHDCLGEYMDGLNFVRRRMVERNAIFNASMALLKKEALIGLPRHFIDYKFCGDWLFWIELAKKGQIFISGRVLNYFRKHDKDVSGGAYKNGINFPEEIAILKTLLAEGIIHDEDFLHALRGKFKKFKVLEKNLPRENREAIEAVFYSSRKVKRFLNKQDNSLLFRVLKRLAKN